MSQLDPRTLRALTRAMPKAELHLHLDGSLRVETALDIARTPARRGAADVRRACAASSSAPERCADQADLLRAFDLPIAAHAGRRGHRADRGATSSIDKAARQRALHGDPLGAAAPHAAGPDGAAGRRGGLARAPTRPRGGTASRSG